jgi:hypothetical protein
MNAQNVLEMCPEIFGWSQFGAPLIRPHMPGSHACIEIFCWVYLCRQIEALRGGSPEREDLVLPWMMKHYDKEAAVPWKSAYEAAQQHAIPGRRIESVIQSLSKLYANPLAASMTREALEHFQWLSQTSV